MLKIGEMEIFDQLTEFFKRKEEAKIIESKIYDSKNKESAQEDLQELAVWVNSPWSQANENYKIEINCKDGYTAIPADMAPYIWKCEYMIIGYECNTARIWGYGETPQEALENCIKLFDYIQKIYNPEDDSI